MLRRSHTWELAREVGVDRSLISRIFETFVSTLVSLHGNKLYDNIAFFVERFPLYNAKLKSKIASGGDIIPISADLTAMFTDGTRIEICRPDGRNFVQREFYYGKDKVHCLAFQVTTAIDGMIVDMYGGYPGSRHDSHIFNSSLLNDRIRAAQENREIHYKSYMDKGYYTDTHVVAAYHIGPNSPPHHAEANRIMSPQRISVEWGMSKIKAMCPFITDVMMMKVQQSPISKYVFAAALLVNIHTCLDASQSGSYFDCLPPTLEDYLR
jgi:hypothetical protein